MRIGGRFFFLSDFLGVQDGTNALMAAASNGHLEAATSLVKAGAALDKQNSDGHSALMFAYNGRAQVWCCRGRCGGCCGGGGVNHVSEDVRLIGQQTSSTV